jgi:hypothetical protein
MRIVGRYSFAGGQEYVEAHHPQELAEIVAAIESIDAEAHRVKESRESTMPGRLLFAPRKINAEILEAFLYTELYGWKTPERVLPMHYSITDLAKPAKVTFTTDGLKNRVALEVQLGKYAFVEYDICAKLPIYKRFGRIDCAIEVIPMNRFVRQMSTGPGWFERTATILENRGYSHLDVPLLLLGIDA